MILDHSKILELLKGNQENEAVTFAKKSQKKLCVHIFGDGMDTYLETINSFENANQYIARKKYSRSNKDIMERITRPIDKIFSTKGGSVFYNLPESQNQTFRNLLQNTENGLTIRKWIEQYWKPAYLSDPMGLIFIEVNADGEAYPTYKSSSDIYSYQLDGRNVEYVIFKTEEEDVFRVVDEVADYKVKFNGKDVTIIDTFPNHFGFVPAMINSDIPVLRTEYFESPLQKIIELADEYLRECSVKSLYKLLHGFPKYWEYISQCKECKGTGNIAASPCPHCNGTGSKIKWDVADVKHLPIPEKEDVVIAPNVAGYVTPPLPTWEKMSDELEMLERIMFQTIWGTKQVEEGSNNTATGRFIDTQPVNDRLSKFSDAAETIERFITDCLGRFYFPTTYKGSSINYGRRFIIESADTVWNKYEKARQAGAPDSVLDDILMEYVQSKYENNSLEMQKQIKMIKIEPFIHHTSQEVKKLEPVMLDYVKKLYFSDFIKTLTDNELIFESTDILKRKLEEFATMKFNNLNNN